MNRYLIIGVTLEGFIIIDTFTGTKYLFKGELIQLN